MADHHHLMTSTSELDMSKKGNDKRVAVVYYLSRNGNLQHPHFIQVPLSAPDGLYLRDVINRLNSLRGKGMAGLYSWSCKRSYKSGFVWQDLAENDFIYPVHGQEYVLKGSELLVDSASALISKSNETVNSCSEHQSPECKVTGENSDIPVVRRRRNQSWSAIDLHEYKVYKSQSTGESVSRVAADASTQTDDKRRRRVSGGAKNNEGTTELSRDEISPPPSDSSPEALEIIKNAERRIVQVPESEQMSTAGNDYRPSPAPVKASSVLLQLISCGSVSFSDFSLLSHTNGRLPRGEGQNQVKKEAGEVTVGSRSFNLRGNRRNKVKVLEDKEYFSGSLIEAKKDQFPVLQRSSSNNADGRSKLEWKEEKEGWKDKCTQRKQSTQSNRSTNRTTDSTTINCDNQQCSIVKT